MGLSIYYKGRFKKEASLKEMIDEVKDIAIIHQWSYHIFETKFDPSQLGADSFDENIFGICFSPLKCEPVSLTFLSNGRMCHPVFFELYNKSKEIDDHSFTIFTKTQFAGVEAHRIIIDLLRYLSNKYFEEFELTDESGYWETNDEDILRQGFKRYNALMDMFSEGLNHTPKKENESIEDFIIRVAEMMKLKKE